MLKRIASTIIMVMMSCCAYAETILEYMPMCSDTTEFLCGIQLYYEDGDILESTEVDEDQLSEGFVARIMNGLSVGDKYVVFCVQNGYLQPFTIDGEYSRYKYVYIDGGEYLDLNISFSDMYISEADTQYLHLIVVGLCDAMPQDADDYIGGGNFASLTFKYEADSESNIDVELAASDFVMNDEQTEQYYEGLYWYEEIMEDGFTDMSSHYAEVDDEFKQGMVGISSTANQIIVFVDNVPYVGDDDSLECYIGEEGVAYLTECHIDDIEEGLHKVYVMQMPIYDESYYGSITEMITIEAK